MVRIRAFTISWTSLIVHQSQRAVCSKTPAPFRGLRLLVLAVVWAQRSRHPTFTSTVDCLHSDNREGGHQTPANPLRDLRMFDPHGRIPPDIVVSGLPPSTPQRPPWHPWPLSLCPHQTSAIPLEGGASRILRAQKPMPGWKVWVSVLVCRGTERRVLFSSAKLVRRQGLLDSPGIQG